MTKKPSFGTPWGVLTCLTTFSFRTTSIGTFLDYFSLGCFRSLPVTFGKKRLKSLDFALNFVYNKRKCSCLNSLLSYCATNQWRKIASNFSKVNEAKLTTRNAFINNISELKDIKQPENDEETLFWDFLGSPELSVNPI